MFEISLFINGRNCMGVATIYRNSLGGYTDTLCSNVNYVIFVAMKDCLNYCDVMYLLVIKFDGT